MAHRSRFIGAGAIALAIGVLIAMPTFSSGATVKNDLRSFQPAQSRAVHEVDPATARTEPPLHGTNPHGQGTAAVIDLTPERTRPFAVDARGTSGEEDIVLGRSRGEQRADGTYHGHVTVAALFGNEVLEGADTEVGETVDKNLGPLSVAGITLTGVEVFSNTTATGSENRFTLLTATIGAAVQGVPGAVPALAIGAAHSEGTISSDGVCQEARGSSDVADVRASTAVVAELAESSSRSRACRGQAPLQEQDSRVLELGNAGVALPAAGCDDGTPDVVTEIVPGLGVLTLVCNADDSSITDDPSPTAGTQADVPGTPYGVRNALDVYVLALLGDPLAQVSTAQAESLAVAPAAATTTTTPTTTTPVATTTPTTPAVPAQPVVATPEDETGPGAGTTGDEGLGDDGAGNEGAGANGGPGDDTFECSDGVDNDGDGKIDFGSDPECASATDDSEAGGPVNLAGRQLPFTGTDVVVLGLAGSILLAAGLRLRGPGRRRELDA